MRETIVWACRKPGLKELEEDKTGDASDGGVWRVTFKGAASIDTRIRIIEARWKYIGRYFAYPRSCCRVLGSGT